MLYKEGLKCTVQKYEIKLKESSPINENSVIIYTSSLCSKLVGLSFSVKHKIVWTNTKKKIYICIKKKKKSVILCSAKERKFGLAARASFSIYGDLNVPDRERLIEPILMPC